MAELHENPHALLVEDDRASLRALDLLLRRSGFTTSLATSVRQAREELRRRVPQLALLDLRLPDGDGMELLADLRGNPSDAARPEVEVVVLSGTGTVEAVVTAMRAGARDFLTKPLDPGRLDDLLAQCRERFQRTPDGGASPLFVGRAPAIAAAHDLAARVASTSSTVLLSGETGTGKSLLARHIHLASDRRARPLVTLSCGSARPARIESWLRRGELESVAGGTLLLDDVTELPHELQSRLLRVLEDAEFERLVDEDRAKPGVRVIATSSRSPEEAVDGGRLRADLYYRLGVFPIEVPPLRQYLEDLPDLAAHFLARASAGAREVAPVLSQAALQRLERYDWPGNVRELRNVLERALILTVPEADEVGPEVILWNRRQLADSLRAGSLSIVPGMAISDAERILILATLEELEGDKRRAAAHLGISLKTLYNRLNCYGYARGSNPGRPGAVGPGT